MKKETAEKWETIKRICDPQDATDYGRGVTIKTEELLEIKSYLENEKERLENDYRLFFEFLQGFAIMLQAMRD